MGINIFKKAADAQATGGGNYIRDGIYTWMVECLKAQSGKEGDCYIGELRVVTAEQDPDHPDVKPNPVGSTVSFVYNVTKHDSAPGNIKGFCIGLLGGLGYTAEQVDESAMTETCDKSNPLRGALLKGKTYRHTTRETKKVITLVRWESVPQTEADIKAGREHLAKAASVPVNAPADEQPAGKPVASVNVEQTISVAPAPSPSKPSMIAALMGEK